jgi:MFS family permease
MRVLQDNLPESRLGTRVSGWLTWRWVHVIVAALAMVATLPGRTHGLGLFTEPILRSLHLDRASYGFLNFWATLLGGLFCLPCGWLLDRFGTRAVLAGVTVTLGVVVIAMSGVSGAWSNSWQLELPPLLGGPVKLVLWDLFFFLLLTRGLGQSALSVASLSLVGRSAAQRTGLVMGVYAFATAAGFSLAINFLRPIILARPDDWRPVWAGIGITVTIWGVVSALLIRNRLLDADAAHKEDSVPAETSQTLGQALRSPAFWTFSLGTSFYGLVTAGISLFNESILTERGFDKGVFLNVVRLGFPVGLASNLLAGWLATRWPLSRLLGLALLALGGTLRAFPWVQTEGQVYLYAAALAAAGGAITVCFFTVWRRGFGPAYLGQIQGAAQILTVVASALGPPVFASFQAQYNSYLPLFPWLATFAVALGAAAWAVGLPGRPHSLAPEKKGSS